MDKARASHLFESGRSHALAADLLYRSALAEGVANGVKDPADYAFNGSYSLSTFYLLGLGLELMLKAAIVAHDGPSDERSMREIGHDMGGDDLRTGFALRSSQKKSHQNLKKPVCALL